MSGIKVGLEVKLPKPVNFLRPYGHDDAAIDVGALTDEEIEAVGEAIKQDFIRHARARRNRRSNEVKVS